MRLPSPIRPPALKLPAGAATGLKALMLTCSLLAAAPAISQQCSPAGGGPPCESATGIAGLGDADGADVTVGNPIHPITGNKYQEEADSAPLPGFLGLEIRRHFNSSYASADSPWGKGWSLSYDTRVHRGGATLQIIQADGRRLIFAAPSGAPASGEAPAAAACASTVLGQGQLFAEPFGYRWIWPQQRELLFDHSGNLTQIGPPGAGPLESVTIARNAEGRILRVTDPAGRTMRFEYDTDGRLASIEHPLGRWRYRIDAAGRLQSVTDPDQAVRRYRYADLGHPTRFTAITVEGPGSPEEMVGQWSYDSQGRADSYRRGDGSELRLAYQQGSHELQETVSVLTNAVGDRTTFKAVAIAGRWRVTEVAGPGCEECGPSNIRMRYDAEGQLLARTSVGGGGVTYLRDRSGRVALVSARGRDEENDHIVARRTDARGAPAPGPAAPAGREPSEVLQRFEYPDDHTILPRLVARPSVVPGREHRWVFERDDRGNVVELVQTGHVAQLSQQPGSGTLPMVRTWRMRYQQIGGRRLLVEVDGSLPNGPAGNPSDSDITRFRHDGEGRYLAATELPGGGVQRYLSRDAAGRPRVILSSDGHREIEERLTYDIRGHVLESETIARFVDGRPDAASAAPLRATFGYDLHGRLAQSADPAGRIVRHQRDAAGRVSGSSDARGYRSSLVRDAEGRVRIAALHLPGSEAPSRAAYQDRGADGRLQSMLLADGRQYGFHYDVEGRTVGITGAAGLLHVAMPAAEPPGVSSDVVDDFGQLRKQSLPDHGSMSWRYDEAGRVVEVNDATGAHTGYRYDAAGRLLARSLKGVSQDVDYSYEGQLLTAVDDPAQTVLHRRDARGRIVETVTTLRGLPGFPLKVSTTYDPATGLVEAMGLADGQALLIRRRGPTEGATPAQLDLRSAFWTRFIDCSRRWLPGGLSRSLVALVPTTPVARKIDVHPFDGLTGFNHHNGMAFKRQVDPVGRTTSLFAGHPGATVSHWRYTYGTGSRIKAIERVNDGQTAVGGVSRQVFAYRASGALSRIIEEAAGQAVITGAPPPTDAQDRSIVLDTAGRVAADSRFRYVYSGLGQLEAVYDLPHNRLVASYAYNHLGQRVRKSVSGGDGEAPSTTYFLWNEQRLVAEIEPDGTIVNQFLSLDDGRRSLPIAILSRSEARRQSAPELLALHADHRGAPVALSDARRQVVWRADVSATGLAIVHQPRGSVNLNLRLPGQYWDAETGLHDNWHRSYDPRSGRYLQPDPLGYPDGPDPYAYAGGDPVNRTDPHGLYELDIHYYMTFFLGVTAGLDPQEARIVALAAQYVDDNPLTRPVDSTSIGTTLASVLRNQRRLVRYHFVLSGNDGRTLPQYRNSRLNNADSPQLRNLFDAAAASGIGRDASLQLLGEYLHALADTYSHRDASDHPYDALIASCGVGHGHDLHAPDLTYDDVQAPGPGGEGQPPARTTWRREARTLEMESNLHRVLLAFGSPADARSLQEIESVLREFNAIRESESSGKRGSATDFVAKRALLQQQLVRLGYGRFDLASATRFGYDVERAAQNRRLFLSAAAVDGLSEETHPGVCLEGGRRCKSE